MTNSDSGLQNSNVSLNLDAGSPNRVAGSQERGAGSGIRRGIQLNLTRALDQRCRRLHAAFELRAFEYPLC